MIHQLLVKLFVLLFVINVQLIWLYSGHDWLLGIAFINLVWLFVVLFQHRSDLTAITPEGKRTLFSPGVFLFITIAVWIRLYSLVNISFWTWLSATPVLWSIFWSLLFWVASVTWFWMVDWKNLWRKKLTQWVLWVLLLLCLTWIWVQFQWLGEKIAFWWENEEVVPQWVIVEAMPEKEILSEKKIEDEIVIPLVEEVVEEVIVEETSVRYGEILPLLIAQNDLQPTSTFRPTFVEVGEWNPLYESFRIAYQYGMIGTNASPDWFVWCDNAMVLRWLAEWWSIDSGAWVLDAYWNAAQEKWLTQWVCEWREWIAVQSTLLD